jgi:hypothetical protein
MKQFFKPRWVLDANSRYVPIVASFNKGYSHIGVDDKCWVLYNGHPGELKSSRWIFPEAKDVLDTLPRSPEDHEPYLELIRQSMREDDEEHATEEDYDGGPEYA